MSEVRAATICLTATADKTKNVEQAETLVREAARLGADWVLLPEIFHFHGPYDQLWDMAEPVGGALLQRLATLARDLRICLFAGTIGERPEVPAGSERRVYNTHYVFDRTGSVIAKYRKIHLFNLLDSHGKRIYCEEDGFLAGSEPVRCVVDGFEVGLSICYDVRFPELYTRLAKGRPLDVIVCPAAFTLRTGKDHWELLLRARAVEHQCYVYASNQTGLHSPGKESYGHSMVIDPWGHTLADTGEVTGIAMATISHERIMAVRGQLPALANRRPEVYGR